tara:strand:+ start:10081 stop:10293 length:213 start_codon:yes stop_codon:yes gene_type:complete
MGNISKMIEKVIAKVNSQSSEKSASYLDVEELYNTTSSAQPNNIINVPQIKVGFKKGGKVKDAMPKAKPC